MIPPPQLVAVNTLQRSFRISLLNMYVKTSKIILKAPAMVNPREGNFLKKISYASCVLRN